jgi:hypothetical protein
MKPTKARGWDNWVWATVQAESGGPGYGRLGKGGDAWRFWPAQRPERWEGEWGYNFLPIGAPAGAEVPIVRLRSGLPRAGGNTQEALTAALCLARVYARGHLLSPEFDAAREIVWAIERLAETAEFEARFGNPQMRLRLDWRKDDR